MSVTVFNQLLGKTLTYAAVEGDDLVFKTPERLYRFTHFQSCCENVCVEDVCGDLQDLVGSPLLVAEQVDNMSEGHWVAPKPEDPEDVDSFTWTFYKFATKNGCVTVRFLGTSNGYYGEGVDLTEEAL